MKRRISAALAALVTVLGIFLLGAPGAHATNSLCPNSPDHWNWTSIRFGRGWCVHDSTDWVTLFQPSDGHLVVYNSSHRAVWTDGNVYADHGFAQSDGNWVLTDAANHPLYQSHTSGHALAPGDWYSAIAIFKAPIHYVSIYHFHNNFGTKIGELRSPIAD